MFVCSLEVRKKVAETMPMAQRSLLGQVVGSDLLSMHKQESMAIPTAIHRDVSRLCSALHSRFGCYSGKKDLCAVHSFLGFEC